MMPCMPVPTQQHPRLGCGVQVRSWAAQTLPQLPATKSSSCSCEWGQWTVADEVQSSNGPVGSIFKGGTCT